MKLATLAVALAVALSGSWAANDAAAQAPPTKDPRAHPGNKQPPKPQFPEEDRMFMMKAAADSIGEVELGKVAQQKSAHPEVKKYAARMVVDHDKANQELKALAAAKKVALPAAPSREAAFHADKMQKLAGPDFDRAYAEHMVADHKKAVDLFTKASGEAKDPDVKAFAARTLPTLQEHLKMAQATEMAVKKGAPVKGGPKTK